MRLSLIMANPFDFFDEIYCINLDSRPDKWEASLLEFEKVGIQDRVKRFSGVKPEGGTGGDGCTLSHYNLMKQISESDAEIVLICEDDVEFKDNTLETLELGIAQIKMIPWDMFYLGINPLMFMPTISENLVKMNAGYTTHCYAVTKEMAKILYEEIKNTPIDPQKYYKLVNPIDTYYNAIHNAYQVFCLKPMVALQCNNFSDITEKMSDNGAEFEEKFIKYT